jgi:23S rRNA pseudouridine1911/1915/1917 synthase
MSIVIAYVDTDCVVVDKPSGMPSAGAQSALESVCEFYPEIASLGNNPIEGGLAHRLDTGTSGLLMFARTPESYLKLRDAFSKGLIKKTYVALVEGKLKQDCVIDFPIAHHPKNKAKMLAITPKNKYFRGKAKLARTEVSVVGDLSSVALAKGDDLFTKIHVKIQGGRRHQIRVHLAAIGHPLVGDVLYGAQPITWRVGHALHADSIILPNGYKVVSVDPFT